MRNKALAAARGNMIAFTDADCVAARDWLSRIFEGMKDTGASIVMGRRLFAPRGSGAVRIFEDYENSKVEYVLGRFPRKKWFGYTNNMAVRRDLFEKVGSFDARVPVLGDCELVNRCASLGASVKAAYLPGAVVTHLEIYGLRSWFTKIGSYGKGMRLLKAARPGYAELTFRERWEIYRYNVKKHYYGFFKAALFLALLAAGDVLYTTAFFCGRKRGG